MSYQAAGDVGLDLKTGARNWRFPSISFALVVVESDYLPKLDDKFSKALHTVPGTE